MDDSLALLRRALQLPGVTPHRRRALALSEGDNKYDVIHIGFTDTFSASSARRSR